MKKIATQMQEMLRAAGLGWTVNYDVPGKSCIVSSETDVVGRMWEDSTPSSRGWTAVYSVERAGVALLWSAKACIPQAARYAYSDDWRWALAWIVACDRELREQRDPREAEIEQLRNKIGTLAEDVATRTRAMHDQHQTILRLMTELKRLRSENETLSEQAFEWAARLNDLEMRLSWIGYERCDVCGGTGADGDVACENCASIGLQPCESTLRTDNGRDYRTPPDRGQS